MFLLLAILILIFLKKYHYQFYSSRVILDPCPQLSKTLLIFIRTHLAVIIYLLSPYINWWRTDFFTILNHEVDLSCLKKVRKGTWSQGTRGWTSMACPGGCDPQGRGGEESLRVFPGWAGHALLLTCLPEGAQVRDSDTSGGVKRPGF